MSQAGINEALARWAANRAISDEQAPLEAAWEEAVVKYGKQSKQARKLHEQIRRLEERRP